MVRTVIAKVPVYETMDGDGARVKRPFPTREQGPLDPFVMLDEFDLLPPAGFPDHPHRGFEIITYMISGAFLHKDSVGNDRIIQAGSLQRITVGRGIVHSEFPGTPQRNRGLQLWLNLPRHLKQIEPEYQEVTSDELPHMINEGNMVTTIVGAGSPVELHTDVRYEDAQVAPGGNLRLGLPDGMTTLLYLLEGTLQMDEQILTRDFLYVLSQEGTLEASARLGCRFVVFAGKPHGEPIRMRGPFVD